MEYHSYSTINLRSYAACPDCDLLMPKFQPEKGHKTLCPRCGRTLMRHCRETVSRALAIALSGLLLFFPATLMPLLTFTKLGLSESGNILQTVQVFIEKDYYIVAAAVFFSAVCFPLVKLSSLAIISISLLRRRFPASLGRIFRLYNKLEEWAMVEVYLLGIMITIIKMHDTADIYFNIGFYCFIGLVLLTMASSLTICKESFWNLIESKGRSPLHRYLQKDLLRVDSTRTTAIENGLILCTDCGRLSRISLINKEGKKKCRRCGAPLHLRKPNSVSRTFALLLTAAILFFPANLLPIMKVEFLGIPSHSTILDGISLFFQDGSYLIALIILAASILVPVFKIVGLSITLFTIRMQRLKFLRQKTMMFRFIEFIGRWSMLDIFVIALLGFFVNFRFLTSIETAPAATYFCLVVIATMLAAITFDPRIMWDLLLSHNRMPANKNNSERQ